MNRHQSNPFLADWDDDEVASAVIKNGPSIFDSIVPADDPTPVTVSSAGPAAIEHNQMAHNSNKSVVPNRRHSSSGGNANALPDGSLSNNSCRRGDRRLYHRNMSSFEVASLHQQLTSQQQENGTLEDPDAISSELARMTAEFKSAMESKDKENPLDDDYDIDRPIDGFNPFDPFETIVDDDISDPSPGVSTANSQSTNPAQQLHHQSQHQPIDKQNFDTSHAGSNSATSNDESHETNYIAHESSVRYSQEEAEREADAIMSRIREELVLPIEEYANRNNNHQQEELENGQRKQKHDSIDDDDEELISTPVRNIKSSSFAARQPDSNELIASQISNTNYDSNHDERQEIVTDGHVDLERIQENSNSIEKAHLFATLLDSAESNAVKIGNSDLDEDPVIEARRKSAANYHSGSSPDNEADLNVDYARVIKGSPTALDGNIDRPVGYFDPFETVIDRDALTSMCSDATPKPPSNAFNRLDINHGEEERLEFDEQPRGHVEAQCNSGLTISDTGYQQHHSHQDSSTSAPTSNPDDSSSRIRTTQPISTSLKVDTTTTTKLDNNSDSNYCALPRPKARQQAIGENQVTPMATPIRRVPKSTPVKQARATKRNKAGNKNGDSDDSSESSEDEHLKIVIKARSDVVTQQTPSKWSAEPGGINGDNEDNTGAKTSGAFVMAPILLPPPPSKSSMLQAMQEEAQAELEGKGLKTGKRTGKNKKKSSVSSSSSASSSFTSSFPNKMDHCDATSSSRLGDDNNAQLGNEHKKSHDEHVDEDEDEDAGQFIIRMTHSDEEALADDGFDPNKDDADEPLYDQDTTYQLEDFATIPEAGFGWKMLLRYPPKKKFTSNRFWKEIAVRVEEVPITQDAPVGAKQPGSQSKQHTMQPNTCIALQIYNKLEEKKPMQEIPLQPTYTVSEISSQQLDQFGKLFTVKLQYVFYKERVGVRQGQLARFIHGSGTSTTSGGHGIDPLSVGAIKRLGAPVEHSPQISQIVKLGSTNYHDIKEFKNCLEDHLFRMPIQRDRALASYKTEEIQMLVRDETYLELNQVGQITRQMARVRLFFLSFLNGSPTIEVGVNDICRQGREVVGRMDILPVITEEWIRLEACELHSTVDRLEFENRDSRLIKFVPPDATFFELMRFRVRPPRNRELPLQISANMSVTRTKVVINVECVVAGSVSRKMGPIPCENIAIRVAIPDCWIYQFREEKHFRMGSKKSVKNTPGRIKGMGRFLGGAAPVINAATSPMRNQHLEQSSMGLPGGAPGGEGNGVIEVTSGQAKYEHHHKAIVWRAAKWPKDNQTAYVTNSMKIHLLLIAYDQMPTSFDEFVYVEYCMPATTVSHTSLRSISVNPCDDEPPEKFVKYSAKYEYKCKMRQSINLTGQGTGIADAGSGSHSQMARLVAEPKISLKREPDRASDLQREEDSDDDDDDEDYDQNEGDNDKKEVNNFDDNDDNHVGQDHNQNREHH